MTGRVLSLHRWPVKSMGGEDVDALRVDHRGAGGDRTHVLLDEHKGRTLVVGDAVLELLHPCVRCVMPTRDPDTQERWPELLRWLHAERDTLFGMNARVTAPATISVGDAVSLR